MKKNQTVSALVKQIKTAIQNAQEPLNESGLKIDRVELEIKTTLVESGGAEAKLKIIPVELSGHYEQSEIQTITMSMVPEPRSIELCGTIDDKLKDAIEIITNAVQEVTQSHPIFELTDASVQLNIGVTKDGSIQVIIGAKGKEITTHIVKLFFRRHEVQK